MEIQIQHIDSWVTEEDLYRRIAKALHTPPVRLPGQTLTNFRLLLPKTARNRHKGYAFLTIAEFSTASTFLVSYNGGRKALPLTVARDGHHNTLKLTQNGFGREDVIRDILRYSYEDWDERQRRLRGDPTPSSSSEDDDGPIRHFSGLTIAPAPDATIHRANLAFAVSARHQPSTSSRQQQPRKRAEAVVSEGAWSIVQFGVVCEDGSFSIEDFDSLATPLPSGFDVKKQVLEFGDKRNGIRILFNNIVSWSIDRAHNALAFELEDPATFIRDGRNSSTFDFAHDRSGSQDIKERMQYHVPCIGCHFRVCFVTVRDLDWFCLEARPFLKRAGNPRQNPRPIVRRNLIDPHFYQAAAQYCASIDLRVAYQFEKLFRNGLYSPTVLEILKNNTRRLLKIYGADFAAKVLESLATTSRQVQVRDRNTKCLLASSKLQQRIQAEEERLKRQHARQVDVLDAQVNSTATAQVFHVTITPTRTLLEGPFMDASNRVLRLFPEFGSHFLRVAFCDEDGDRFPVSRHDFADDIDSESFVRERIGTPLKEGIDIAGRRFEALAWSGSGLGSHHCWFVTAFTDKDGKWWNAERIRASLGNFSRVENQPARFGARLSQAFSATSSTIRISDDWIQIVEDDFSHALMPSSNGNGRSSKQRYLLTDGVGEISRALLNEIWRELCAVKNMRREWTLCEQDAARIPSAIQFRLGGAKGVLCLNPQLKGKVMKVRHSMIKFSAPEHRDLEVATTSFSALPARLNRPLINALEDLGVPAHVFLTLQDKAVESAQSARKCFRRASQLMGTFALSDTAEMHRLFRRLDSIVGIQPDQLPADGILNRLCTIVIAAALGDLKRKARIPVDGCTLIGVVDEFGFLQKGEIFAQVDYGKDGSFTAVEGRVMVGRSPTIHPGDVRVVNAVVPPRGHPLWQLRNVLVFNKCPTGRPLQSILSGGDLDGDIYTIYRDPQLFPKRIESPGQYKTVAPRSLAAPCTFADLADFFVDYVINDQVGLVSHFHLQIADKSHLHSLDPDCIRLAQLHAKAVDYRKTGQAVHRRDVPMPPFGAERPDFLVQRPAGPGIYPSTRALGQLYRAIPEERTDTPFGAQPGWARAEGKQSALSNILKHPGKSDDVLTVLSMLAQRYPQILPDARLDEMQEHFRPLLASFVYHLSRLAAWIPESRTETDWLSEEEILIGTQVMAIKAKQLKRRQERLTASTAELFPILKAQLQLIAGDESVETSTIRPVAGEAGKGKGKGKAGQTVVPGKEPVETKHFAGYTVVAGVEDQPRPKPRGKMVFVDGERVMLRETASGDESPDIWSHDEFERDQDLHVYLNRVRERFVDQALARSAAKEAAASRPSSSRAGNGKTTRQIGNGSYSHTNGNVNTNRQAGPSRANANGNTNGKGKAKSKPSTTTSNNSNSDHTTPAATSTKGKHRHPHPDSSDSDSRFHPADHGLTGQNMTAEDAARRKRRKELRVLYAACYLGASEASTRHFGGNTFAVVALGCLLEMLEEHQVHGRLF
ncbi:related to RNA-dependent RNA polymerase [Sporisorium reilianum SRZ2]|uniref:Related to RNA-dependent RNA polymerase n=1 Tax=Sporisorium reilianum (strain SRZ2) TaxID=999809 RepID=E6ZWC3_SPORE|nr:related to RNA-dependent RNA polymerase [Sporisorium reilianum SRZ2]